MTPTAFASNPVDGSSALVGTFGHNLTYANGIPPLVATTASYPDGFIIGLDPMGAASWATQIAGMGAKTIGSILPVNDGWIVLGGSGAPWTLGGLASASFTNSSQGFIAKISSSGTALWSVQIETDSGDANPASGAIDPATGDLLVVGWVGGSLHFERNPGPLGDAVRSHQAVASPFFARIGGGGDLKKVEFWQSSAGAHAQGIALGKNAMNNVVTYVFGDYLNQFPATGLVTTPAAGSTFDAFMVTMNDMDVPQQAVRFGSDSSYDSAVSGFSTASGDVVALVTYGAATPPTGFAVGTSTILDSSFTAPNGAVLTRFTPNGNATAMTWGKAAGFPGQFSHPSLAQRMNDPLLMVFLETGTTTYDTHAFSGMFNVHGSAFFDISPADGTLTNDYVLVNNDVEQAFLASSSCGDTVICGYRGTVSFQGQVLAAQTSNTVVSHTKMPLAFAPPP